MAQEKMYKAALEAIDQGQTTRARDLFTRLLRSDSSKAEYWLWMSTLVDTNQERIYCLESALRADPENEAAKRGLIILGARQAGDEVTPVPLIQRHWEKELEDIVEPPNSIFQRIWSNQILRLATGLIAALIVVGILLVVFNRPKSQPEQVIIYKVSPFPTDTPSPTITPTITRTMIVRTRTPTIIGPTPLWVFLPETYTPIPIYVNTPHPVIEAYRAGIRAYEESDWKSLLDFMDQAISIDSTSPDLYYYRGEAYRLLDMPKDAVIEFGKALDINPKFAPAYIGLAHAYQAIKPSTNVEGELSYAIEYDPYYVDAYLARAKFRIVNGNPQGALEDILLADSLFPENPMVYVLRAQANLALNDPYAALEDALHAQELDTTLLPAYLTLAQVYLELQDIQQALNYIGVYLRYIKNDAEGWAVKAQADYQAGNIDQALDACTQGISVNEENAPSWYYCGLIHLEQGDSRTAVNELVKATNLNPLNFEYSLSLAKALWEDGRLDTTILQYKYAETITTTDAQRAIVYYFMAQVYQQMGNTSKESQAWRFLLDLPVDQVPADWRILALERWYFLNPDVPTETPQDSQVPLITETPTRTPIPTITRHPTQTPLTINTSAPTPNE